MERSNYYIKKCSLQDCIKDTILKYEMGIKNLDASLYNSITALKALGIESGICKYFAERHAYWKYDLEKRLFHNGILPGKYIYMPPIFCLTVEEIFSALNFRIIFLKKWLKDLDKT